MIYLRLNGTIANALIHDLDLYFQDNKFEMLISQK